MVEVGETRRLITSPVAELRVVLTQQSKEEQHFLFVVGFDRCWHFTFSPDDSKIIAACGRSNNVMVIDAKTYEVLKDIPVPGMPWGVVAYPKAMGSLDQP